MLEKIFHMKQDRYIMEKKKYKKGIYGKASVEEIHDLNNEGIETAQIPWVKDNEN